MAEWSKPNPSPRTVTQAGATVPAATLPARSGARRIEEPTEYDAILLASYGGPNGQDDVIPFLRNVTSGRNIPDERLEEVATHYRSNGGVSPINEQNLALKAALEKELAARGIDLPVYFGNRNWEPYFTEAIATAHKDNNGSAEKPTRIYALTTSAYSAYSSCRQYREDFADVLEALDLWDEVQIDKSRTFFDHPGFVNPFIDGTIEAVQRLKDAGLDLNSEIEVMFSAHSIPLTDNELSGEPALHDYAKFGAYKAQHLAVAELVMEAVNKEFGTDIIWNLVYQSESGPGHIPWLEPDISDAIEALDEKRKGLVVVPATFLSDHMEVWWDLDIEAKEAADEKGLQYYERVPTPGVNPQFVSGLVDILEERLNGTPEDQRPALTKYGPGNDVCQPGCCQSAGPLRAAICGQLP